MKNNIDYFKHETGAFLHPKFKALRVRFGWAGEGRFWALNSLIGDADNCELDLSIKRNRISAAADIGLTGTEFDKFVEFLKSEDCELVFEIRPGVITTDEVQKILNALKLERERSKRNYTRRNNESTSIQHGEPIQSKVKESKVYKEPESAADGRSVETKKIWTSINGESITWTFRQKVITWAKRNGFDIRYAGLIFYRASVARDADGRPVKNPIAWIQEGLKKENGYALICSEDEETPSGKIVVEDWLNSIWFKSQKEPQSIGSILKGMIK